MQPITRILAVATVAVAGLSVTACTGDPADPGTTESTTTSQMTTTRSTPAPGVDGEPVAIPAPVADRWNELGGPDGGLGSPTGPATDVEGGSVTDFERGSIVVDPEGRAFLVQGEILRVYRESGGPAGELGFPTSDETTTDGGWISTFEHGTIAYLDGEAVVEAS